ncbi:MAG: ABC transporter permease [Actinobacteria bacterium]|nr:ABC transporter permease [Actinomycetota bacterium]
MGKTNSARLTTTVRPSSGWVALRPRELWDYRELFYFLTWRDIKVRYKQTALGAAWAVLQPFLTMVVFSLFFGSLAGIPSGGTPYPVFAFAALVPWTFFATAVALASNSLVEQERILAKVYFPRLIVPAAAVLASLVDLAIAFVVLLIMILVYGIVPSAAIVTLPFFVMLAALAALAVGLWLSALNVLYRDVRYVIPFLVQLWLFISPVAYPSSLVPQPWDAVYGLNPMAGVIEGFRWALLGEAEPPGPMLAVSVAATAALLVGGLLYFRRMERSFADVV